MTTIGRSRSDIENDPGDGTIIAPGGSMLLEMTWIWEEDQFADLRFDVLDDSGNVVGTVAVTIAVGRDAGSTGAASSATSGNFQTSRNTAQDTVYFDDPAGTVRTVNGNQAQLQAQLLQQVCADGSQATCTFHATSQTHVDGPSHQLVSEENNSPNIADLTATNADEVSSTDSVEVGATVRTNIANIVDAEISAKYSHTWSTSHTFSTGGTNHVSPHSFGEVTAKAPMLRVTGDFHATMSNTTINLDGVYFDSPDATGAEHFGYDEHPLTPTQQATLPTGVSFHAAP